MQVEVTENEAFPVWRENWQSVLFLLACETQWVGVGRFGLPVLWTGINYASAAALLSLRPRSEQQRYPSARLMADLRVMERVALPIMNGDG